MSILALCLHLSVLGFYKYGLHRSILEDAELLLVAAPFAAVMSTVDSFLLMISSAMGMPLREASSTKIHPGQGPKPPRHAR